MKSESFNAKIMYLVSEGVVTQEKCNLTDKLKAKDYINSLNSNLVNVPKTLKIIGKELVPIQKDFEQYSYPIFLKCNHGCKFNILLKSKKDINSITANAINKYINIDFSKNRNQFQYHNIERFIYLEEFIKVDYLIQFYCFHGEPMFIECIKKGNFLKSIVCNEYDGNYIPKKFTNAIKNYNLTPKHPQFNELLEFTKCISKPFEFVRLDYYIDIDKKIWFSEFTFSPSAGTLNFCPGINEYLGSLI